MNGEKRKLTIEIMGETYALKGDIDLEQTQRLGVYLDTRMRKIAQANPQLSLAKIAVLAALNITDEYLKLERDYKQLIEIVQDQK
jgi:cell division protein ZapA